MNSKKKKIKTQKPPPCAPVIPSGASDLLAVIDIGSTALRMSIAEVDPHGIVKQIEFLQKSVNLGKESFAKGYIEQASIEACVTILEGFRVVLNEYRITENSRIRAIATNAVQEASNRDAFIDRIYHSTGIVIETIEIADVARLNYLGVRPLLKNHPRLSENDVFIVQIGGGSTEVCCFQKKQIAFTQAFRLGSLRLAEMIESSGVSKGHEQDVLEHDISRTIEQFKARVTPDPKLSMVALGGDIRFAASAILKSRTNPPAVMIDVADLQKFTESILTLSVDAIVKKHHIPYCEAETLGPALLFYLRCAQQLQVRTIVVAGSSMRHGLFLEMAGTSARTDELRDLIIQSALAIAEKYQTDVLHVKHVAMLCTTIYRALSSQHPLTPWQELLLTVSAILHDIGLFISSQNHHKHSQYLIENGELFGLSRSDIRIIALIARFHRRTPPRQTNALYAALSREDRALVCKLSAILRVADALDHSHEQRIDKVQSSLADNHLVLEVPNVDDFTLEEVALQNKGGMFKDIFGISVVLQGLSLKEI